MNEEIERLMIAYGLECYAEGKTQVMADTKAKGAALMSAISRALKERDDRIAVLEKALRPLYGAALNVVCMVGIDGGNAEIDAEAIRVLDETLDAAKAALAAQGKEP